MAFGVLRSSLMSRITIGVSRQLIVLESKVTCRERQAQGVEFLMADPSKMRAFSFLTWRNLNMRATFNSFNPPVIEEFKLGSHIISLEMGYDEKNRGSMLCHMDGTTVQSNVLVSHDKCDKVLQVYYDETTYGERWRSHNPTDREIICSQLIDRSIRPLLFTAGFSANITVYACVLKSNSKHDAELMAIIATSAALMILNITRAGPIGVIRIGRIDEKIIINPTTDEQRKSDINLLYVCTRQKAIMVDLVAREISESDLAIYLRRAHLEVVKCIDSQVKLKESYAKDKNINQLTAISKNLEDTRSQSSNYGENLEKNTSMTSTNITAACDIVKKKAHCVSDSHHQIRPIQCEAGYLQWLHGSSLISCGDTQVLCSAIIGEPEEAQSADSLVVLPRKRFSVDYDFPSFCTNHVLERSSPRWFEIGHGSFVEKALLAVIPSERDYPYVIRLQSTVLSSDGSSSSTLSVCGGSIALMDAGVPIKNHVACVSIGLVMDDETSNGQLEKYRIITDILGLENQLGEVDFKIAGTRNGITAIQLDVKSRAGLSLDIISEALNYASQAHLQILDHMELSVDSPKDAIYSTNVE